MSPSSQPHEHINFSPSESVKHSFLLVHCSEDGAHDCPLGVDNTTPHSGVLRLLPLSELFY